MKQFDDLAADAMATYRSLLVEVAEGAKPDSAAALQIALAAGRSAIQLAEDVQIAVARRNADAAFEARDFDAKLAEFNAARVTARTTYDNAQAAYEVARTARDAAKQASDAADSRVRGTQFQIDRADKELSDLLRSTGDANDWRIFRLKGEEKPVVPDWRDNPTRRINIGSGQVNLMASTAGIAL